MVIYKITNQINGKVYIGQTIQPLSKRCAKELKIHRSNIYKCLHSIYKSTGGYRFEYV